MRTGFAMFLAAAVASIPNIAGAQSPFTRPSVQVDTTTTGVAFGISAASDGDLAAIAYTDGVGGSNSVNVVTSDGRGLVWSAPTIVSTDAGSMTEVIEDGVEGLVVPEKDAVALADAIESLLRDPERRKQLGRAAARKVRAKFDVSVCEQWFHERLEQVLADRGVKAP